MYISRNNPKEEIWIPINIHITHERLQVFYSKFVAWLDTKMSKPWSLFLPIQGSKLITDPYGFISIDNVTPSDLAMFDPSVCRFVYQIPIDPATRKICQVEGGWIRQLKLEYEEKLSSECKFSPGDDVIFRETIYKNLRGVFQFHDDPQNPVYSTVAINMFSAQYIVTLPSRYLEKYSETEPFEVNNLKLFFVRGSSFPSDEVEEEIE